MIHSKNAKKKGRQRNRENGRERGQITNKVSLSNQSRSAFQFSLVPILIFLPPLSLSLPHLSLATSFELMAISVLSSSSGLFSKRWSEHIRCSGGLLSCSNRKERESHSVSLLQSLFPLSLSCLVMNQRVWILYNSILNLKNLLPFSLSYLLHKL